MREIVLDTETTGLDPLTGDRVVEIGCIELFNRIPTGQAFHRYVNPDRDVPASAFDVHGLSTEFLKDKPPFAEVAEDFLAFVGDAALVIHNAAFDAAFLNSELERVGKPLIARDRLVDTLLLARRRHPGGANRLDDLCARYGIDNTRRTKHGALLDAELLAEVYIELTGARQAALGLELVTADTTSERERITVVQVRPVPLMPRVTAEDIAAHRAFVATLGDNAIWRDYLSEADDEIPALAPAVIAVVAPPPAVAAHP
ncbi:MAG: DNA polymerase III subunit epsilon [Hyphomicrobiales bacterium]|nr:DNA polymerase III subunit epsilon [Hyphomicrobiales bacterium]MBV8824589.1 DNA polymerase III subunit epsilon [Hyphomicrobiales bacterium]